MTINKPWHFLLIEDSKTNESCPEKINELLEQWYADGYVLAQVNSVPQALVLLQQQHWDVVLLDVSHIDKSANEDMQRILEKNPQVPVIVFGLDDESRGMDVLEQGAHDYFCKNQLNYHHFGRCMYMAIKQRTALDDLHRRLQELDISRTHLRTMVDKNPDGIMVVTEQGNILAANEAAAALFGRSLHDFTGTTVEFPVFSNDTLEVNGRRIELMTRRVHWDGERAYLVCNRDISDRAGDTLEQLKQQLRHRENELEKALETIEQQSRSLSQKIDDIRHKQDEYNQDHQRRELHEQVQQLQQSLKTAEAEKADYAKLNYQLDEKLWAAEKALNSKDEDIHRLMDALAEHSNRESEKIYRDNPSFEELRRLRRELIAKESRIMEQEQEITSLKLEMHQEEVDNARAAEHIKSDEQELHTLREMLWDSEARLQAIEENLEEKNKLINELYGDNELLATQLEQLHTANESSQTKEESLQENMEPNRMAGS